MLFRLLCNLLILIVLLPQFAALPHAHGGELPGDKPHTCLPHFHLHLSHADRHSVKPRAESRSPGRPVPNDIQRDCPCDHDRDAVYVVDTDGRVTEPCEISADTPAHTPSDLLSRLGSAKAIPLAVRNTTGPPTGPDCPIYVRHLSLLI